MWMRCCRCKDLVESNDVATIKIESIGIQSSTYALCKSCAMDLKKIIEEEIVWTRNTKRSQ